jgi:hypothetical protein
MQLKLVQLVLRIPVLPHVLLLQLHRHLFRLSRQLIREHVVALLLPLSLLVAPCPLARARLFLLAQNASQLLFQILHGGVCKLLVVLMLRRIALHLLPLLCQLLPELLHLV